MRKKCLQPVVPAFFLHRHSAPVIPAVKQHDLLLDAQYDNLPPSFGYTNMARFHEA